MDVRAVSAFPARAQRPCLTAKACLLDDIPALTLRLKLQLDVSSAASFETSNSRIRFDNEQTETVQGKINILEMKATVCCCTAVGQCR